MIEKKPYFDTVITGQKTYDLSHLEPFTFRFHSVMAKKELRIRVRYTNHCFTRKLLPEETDRELPIFDTHTERPRIFCPIRYELSKGIKELIENINNEKTVVSQTAARRNWVYSIKIENPEGPYHVFFEIKKTSAEYKKHQDLNMVIESAYHEDPVEGPPNIVGSMSLYILCGKVYTNKPVSTRR